MNLSGFTAACKFYYECILSLLPFAGAGKLYGVYFINYESCISGLLGSSALGVCFLTVDIPATGNEATPFFNAKLGKLIDAPTSGEVYVATELRRRAS